MHDFNVEAGKNEEIGLQSDSECQHDINAGSVSEQFIFPIKYARLRRSAAVR